MAESPNSRGLARETRLLLLTLLVSVAVLFLLARFRFPERPITDLSPPQPLARLGRPAVSFDELSASLTDLLRRFEGAVVVLRTGGGTRVVPGLRVREGLALAPLAIDAGDGQGGPGGQSDSGPEVEAEAGAGATMTDATLVARDELRGLALVRVPERTMPALPLAAQSEPLEVPGFVAVLEASAAGPVIRPEFVSTVTRAERPGWDAPALVLGGLARVQPGALLFSLGGRFIGMVLDAAGGAAVVAPGEALMGRVDSLARGESIRLAQPGFTVQALSAALRKVSGATAGVMVSSLVPTAASAEAADTSTSMPQLGDAITAAGGQPVRSVGDWQRLLANRTAGTTLALDVMRFGKPIKITIALTGLAGSTATASAPASNAAVAVAPAAPQAAPQTHLGATLRATAGGTLDIVSINPASPASLAGLQPGDRVTALLPARGAISPSRIAAAFAALKPGEALILAIDRQGTGRIIAVEKR